MRSRIRTVRIGATVGAARRVAGGPSLHLVTGTRRARRPSCARPTFLKELSQFLFEVVLAAAICKNSAPPPCSAMDKRARALSRIDNTSEDGRRLPRRVDAKNLNELVRG